MEKKPIVILLIVSLIALAIFLIIWIINILMPFIEWAQLLADLGITYTGTISYILAWLFLDYSFIGMVVSGLLALIFRIIGGKSLKKMES